MKYISFFKITQVDRVVVPPRDDEFYVLAKPNQEIT